MALRLFPDCFLLWNQPGKALCVLSFPQCVKNRKGALEAFAPWAPDFVTMCCKVKEQPNASSIEDAGLWLLMAGNSPLAVDSKWARILKEKGGSSVSMWMGSCTTWCVDCSMEEAFFSEIKPKRQTFHPKHGFFSQLQELKGKACCLLMVPVPKSKEGRWRGFPRRFWHR